MSQHLEMYVAKETKTDLAGVYDVFNEREQGIKDQLRIYRIKTDELKGIIADKDSKLDEATTTIEALIAERAQLTAQLTQLRSQAIAREDVSPVQPEPIEEAPAISMYPMPDGYAPLTIGDTIKHGDLYLFMGQWLPSTRIGVIHDGEGLRMCGPVNAPTV